MFVFTDILIRLKPISLFAGVKLNFCLHQYCYFNFFPIRPVKTPTLGPVSALKVLGDERTDYGVVWG